MHPLWLSMMLTLNIKLNHNLYKLKYKTRLKLVQFGSFLLRSPRSLCSSFTIQEPKDLTVRSGILFSYFNR